MKELNTGLAKIGFQQLIYKVLTPAIFFVTYESKTNIYNASYTLWF